MRDGSIMSAFVWLDYSEREFRGEFSKHSNLLNLCSIGAAKDVGI
jgi:hypothetical protein